MSMWYKKIQLTDCMLYEALHLYPFKELKNSITKGGGNLAGAIGEVIVCRYFGNRDVMYTGSYDYDLIIDRHKIEVKTKRRSVEPEPHFNGSVALYNDNQACDYYMFCQVSNDYKFGYLLGYVDSQTFRRNSFILRAGQLDDGWEVKEDCRNMKYINMKRIK